MKIVARSDFQINHRIYSTLYQHYQLLHSRFSIENAFVVQQIRPMQPLGHTNIEYNCREASHQDETKTTDSRPSEIMVKDHRLRKPLGE